MHIIMMYIARARARTHSPLYTRRMSAKVKHTLHLQRWITSLWYWEKRDLYWMQYVLAVGAVDPYVF